MTEPIWLLVCSLFCFSSLFSFVRSRAAYDPPAVAPPITAAPQVAAHLQKRDSPICGYISGNPSSAWACNAPNDCYIFTASSGFYSAKAACGTKGAITSYLGPWGLCEPYLGTDCPNVAACSTAYVSVLFCPSNYPYCVRYEIRDNPNDPNYYVLLDCTGIYHATPIQMYFSPTTAVVTPGPVTTRQDTPTTTPSPSPDTTDHSPSTPTPTTQPTAGSQQSSPPSSSDTSSPDTSSSQGLSVGDKAGIASAIIAAVAIVAGALTAIYKDESRALIKYICCGLCICMAKIGKTRTPDYSAPGYSAPGYSAPGYSAPGYSAPIAMEHVSY